MTASHTLPGPPELLSAGPDAVVNLQSAEGLTAVAGQWRYSDAYVAEVGFVEVADHLGPGDVPNRTYEVLPHAEAADYDDSDWRVLAPEETMRRLSTGRVCFNWYRLQVTIPECVGDLHTAGSTVVLEVVVDDYAEVWVDGQLPLTLGLPGGQVVSGFNAPNRVVLGTDVRPRPDLHRRRVRHQRPDLGGPRQLHLDAERDARLLPSGPGGGGRVRTAGSGRVRR